MYGFIRLCSKLLGFHVDVKQEHSTLATRAGQQATGYLTTSPPQNVSKLMLDPQDSSNF